MLLLEQPRDWHRRSNDRNNGLLPDLPTELAITSKPLIKYSMAIEIMWRAISFFGLSSLAKFPCTWQCSHFTPSPAVNVRMIWITSGPLVTFRTFRFFGSGGGRLSGGLS